VAALDRRIVAGLDVFDQEPLRRIIRCAARDHRY
jgi:phosphoglycerate dehydrogenase-like enzyme